MFGTHTAFVALGRRQFMALHPMPVIFRAMPQQPGQAIVPTSTSFMRSGHSKSRKENPQKLTQLSSRSHPRHLVGKRTAQKDTIIDITSDSQVNSYFPNRWSPASLTFNNYFYLFLYLYMT